MPIIANVKYDLIEIKKGKCEQMLDCQMGFAVKALVKELQAISYER